MQLLATVTNIFSISGVERVYSKVQNLYLGFLTSSIKVIITPHGCGLWAMSLPSNIRVIFSFMDTSLVSTKMERSTQLKKCVYRFGYLKLSVKVRKKSCLRDRLKRANNRRYMGTAFNDMISLVTNAPLWTPSKQFFAMNTWIRWKCWWAVRTMGKDRCRRGIGVHWEVAA